MSWLSPSPASLKLTSSWPAVLGPLAEALMKCGLAAYAVPASASMARTAARAMAVRISRLTTGSFLVVSGGWRYCCPGGAWPAGFVAGCWLRPPPVQVGCWPGGSWPLLVWHCDGVILATATPAGAAPRTPIVVAAAIHARRLLNMADPLVSLSMVGRIPSGP